MLIKVWQSNFWSIVAVLHSMMIGFVYGLSKIPDVLINVAANTGELPQHVVHKMRILVNNYTDDIVLSVGGGMIFVSLMLCGLVSLSVYGWGQMNKIK